MRQVTYTVLLVLFCLSSCGNRHVTKNAATVGSDTIVVFGKADMVESLTEDDVNKSLGKSAEIQKAIAASSYLRAFPAKKDSTSGKAAESDYTTKLFNKKADKKNLNGNSSDSTLVSMDDLKSFSVVAGSFSAMSNALVQKNKLLNLGLESCIVKNENGMFRVVSGTYDERVDAEIQSFILENDSVESWILEK